MPFAATVRGPNRNNVLGNLLFVAMLKWAATPPKGEPKMRKRLAAITLVAIAASIVPSAAEEANATLGLLDCNVEGGMGFIIGSKKNLTCTFTSANKEIAPENYVGVIKKLGLDIGATGKAVLRWRVFAPNNNPYAPGILAGDYTGVSA